MFIFQPSRKNQRNVYINHYQDMLTAEEKLKEKKNYEKNAFLENS